MPKLLKTLNFQAVLNVFSTGFTVETVEYFSAFKSGKKHKNGAYLSKEKPASCAV